MLEGRRKILQAKKIASAVFLFTIAIAGPKVCCHRVSLSLARVNAAFPKQDGLGLNALAIRKKGDRGNIFLRLPIYMLITCLSFIGSWPCLSCLLRTWGSESNFASQTHL